MRIARDSGLRIIPLTPGSVDLETGTPVELAGKHALDSKIQTRKLLILKLSKVVYNMHHSLTPQSSTKMVS